MAEIALAGSIITIVDTGFKVSKGLYDVAKAFGNAGRDVKLVATNVSLLCRVFRQVGDAVKSESTDTRDAESLIEQILSVCDDVLQESKELLEKLQPLVAEFASHHKEALLRLRFLMKKSTFAAHKHTLEGMQTTLNTLLGVMNYKAAVQTQKSESVISSLRVDLENLRTEAEENNRVCTGITRFLGGSGFQIENLSQHAGLYLEDSTGGGRVNTNLHDDGGPEVEDVTEVTGNRENGPSVQSNSDTNASGSSTGDRDVEASSENALMVRSRSRFIEEEELDDPNYKKNLQFIPSEQLDIYLKMGFIQKAVLKYVNHALEPQTEQIWTAQASDVSQPTESVSRSQAAQRVQTPPPNRQYLDPSRDSVQSEGSPPVSSRTSISDEQVINFQDSRGWHFKFPFEECKTLIGLVSHINEVYRNDAKYFYDGHLEEGKRTQLESFKLLTTIYGRDNMYLEPTRYEHHLRPGQKISIVFDDPRLNRKIPDPSTSNVGAGKKINLYLPGSDSTSSKLKSLFRRG